MALLTVQADDLRGVYHRVDFTDESNTVERDFRSIRRLQQRDREF